MSAARHDDRQGETVEDDLPPTVIPGRLSPPRRRHGIVPRERLVKRLMTGRERPVIIIVAPAGYGKTTLLAQLSEADERPAAWVSLDDREPDPFALAAHVAAGLGMHHPVPADLRSALDAPGVSVWDTLMPRLCRYIRAIGQPFLLVLDGADDLTEPEADVVLAILTHLPDGAQLALGTRDPGALPISRLRAKGMLIEVGPSDLAMDDAEAERLLTGAGVSVDLGLAAEINARCEGWPGAIYLHALAMDQATHGPVLVVGPDTAGMSERHVVDFIAEQVLDHLREDDLRFLTRTSILDRMSGELCDAVLKGTGAGATLRRLERSNLFVIAMDPQRTWYRYHRLFRQALQEHLAANEPATAIATLHGRASDWYAQHGMITDALRAARLGPDRVQVARLLARYWQVQINSGGHEGILPWLDWVEAEDVLKLHPPLAVLGTAILAVTGQAERSERWGRVLAGSGRDDADGLAGDLAGIQAFARALACRSGHAAMLADAEAAVHLLSPTSVWWHASHLLLGSSMLMAGRRADADAALRLAGTLVAVEQPRSANAVALTLRAREALVDGRSTAARDLLAEADAIFHAGQLTDDGLAVLADAIAARLAIADGRLEEARVRLVHAQRYRDQMTWAAPHLALLTRVEIGRACLAMADPAGARTVLLEAQEILRRRPGLGVWEQEARALFPQLQRIRHAMPAASTLTRAELRLLPLLATHLTFGQIAARQVLSPNTIKSQAIAIYRKLDASSRAEAVEHAAAIGLLDASLADDGIVEESSLR